MEKRNNLSEKIYPAVNVTYRYNDGDRTFEDIVEYDFIQVKDVKEFIKKILETQESGMVLVSTIKHYAGDKLIGKEKNDILPHHK